MKNNKDYDMLDNNFTKEIIYISNNPTVWEDEGVYFQYGAFKVSSETETLLEYDIYIKDIFLKRQQSTIQSLPPTSSFTVSSLVLATTLEMTGEENKVEIRNAKITPVTPGVSVSEGELSKHIGVVRVLKIPKITGKTDLGNQYSSFNFSVNLDCDSLKQARVTAVLEGQTIYSNNASNSNTTHNINVNSDIFKKLTTNKQYSITIEAQDTVNSSKNSSTNFTFTKISDPPILNIEDKDFGKISSKPIIEYSLTKGENVTIREKIEDKEIRNFKPTIGESYKFQMSDEDWKEFSPNKVITTTIEAEDEYGQVTKKTFTFEKIITRIEIKGKAPTRTDDKVTKVLLRPILRSMEGVKTVNIYACNNGLDNEPTWEDISENSLLHNVSFLENDSKTSEDWAFNLKVVVEREEGYDGEIILDALGGAFE